MAPDAGGTVTVRPAPPPARPRPDLAAKVALLRRPGSYPGQPAEVEAIETHMSWVFLAGERVYKLKKPLVTSYLDFGTVEARRRC